MRLYRALLHGYPASFRAEYGEEMSAIFRRRRRDATGPSRSRRCGWSRRSKCCANAAARPLGHPPAGSPIHLRTLIRDARLRAHDAIVLVAIGVGANTAAFSVTDFVLVRPLPYPDSARLVRAWQQRARRLRTDGVLAGQLPRLAAG